MISLQEFIVSIKVFKDNSYNSYLKHQAFKYFLLKNRLNTNFDFQTKYFKKTFKKLKFLKGNILCLGARTGAEVKSLRDLGYFAIGIDLEYPKKSPYVMYGDFHKLSFPNQSFNIIYGNILDHVYNYKNFFREILRITKTKGRLIFDIQKGEEETERSNFGHFETYGWANSNMIITEILNYKIKLIKKIDLNKNYYRCIFKKSN